MHKKPKIGDEVKTISMKKLSKYSGANYTTIQANVKLLFVELYKIGYWKNE